MTPRQSMDLKEQVAAVVGDQEWFNVDTFKAQIPILETLSDDELRVLEEVICSEGLRRGFGNYWWE